MNPPQVYICPLLLEPPSTSFPIPPLLQSPSLSSLRHTENSLWLSILHVVMYVSMLLSPYVLPSPSSPCLTSINLFSVSVSALPPCNSFHQYHLSRFHIYVLVYIICFSLSDLLCIIGSKFIHLVRTDSNVFLLWLSNIPYYICTTAFLFTCLWMDTFVASMS